MVYFQLNNPYVEPLRVAFLGPLASFSHQAALESFGPTATLLPQPSFADAFAALQAGEADYATIPFENSSNGAVVQTLDLLADREGLYPDIVVCGEYYLSVHHCLLVKEQNDQPPEEQYANINKLYTHPQAWGQCEAFLSKHFNGVERQDVSSTSKAAEIVAQEPFGNPHSAAIASKFAGEYHGLVALAENIEDDPSNMTRFLILRNAKSKRTQGGLSRANTTTQSVTKMKRKSLISFLVDHDSPGALADALVIFKKHGLNLTSINTRPGGLRPWQYIFFVECQRMPEVHGEGVVEKVMKELEAVTEARRNLGSWEDQLNTLS
ncbi:hypothetical protein VTO42DRAFT_6356 [Malbranchea cinnamomea]